VSQKKVWELDHDVGRVQTSGKILYPAGFSQKEQFQSENKEGLRIQKNLIEIDKGSYKSDVMRMLGALTAKRRIKKTLKEKIGSTINMH